MKIIETKFSGNHIQNILSADVYKNIIELVWNALDADSFNVHISLKRNKIGGIEEIIIEDDGHGIDSNKIEDRFKELGYSHKKLDLKSPLGRPYHGKKGQGRYSTINLGADIEMMSIFSQNGKNKTFTVGFTKGNPRKTDLKKDIKNCTEHTGFRVYINSLDKKIEGIDVNKLKEKITLEFADYIGTYGKKKEISVFINGEIIDIEEAIEGRDSFPSKVIDDETGETYNYLIDIVNWKSKGVHSRYFCSEEGVVLWNDGHTGISEKDFGHSVYIKGKVFADKFNSNIHELFSSEKVFDKISNDIKDKLSRFFKSKLRDKSKKFIKELKDKDLYPYKDLPRNEVEVSERDLYDICLYSIHTQSTKVLSGADESKKMILELIKTALEKDPKDLLGVLKNVVELPKDELETLSNLIDKYSLSNLITLSKAITDKMSFICELDEILYGEISKSVLERRHLHKILEKELWVFGDGYLEGTSDKSLKGVLEKHIKLMGREELITDTKMEGKDIPDLFIYKQYPQGRQGQFEHLIIELKKPGLILKEEELNQIKRYADKVSSDSRFSSKNVKWKYILVSNDYDSFVESEITQKGLPEFCAKQTEKYDIYVYRWSEILDGLRWRYGILREQLNDFEETPENLEYISHNYPEIYENINYRLNN